MLLVNKVTQFTAKTINSEKSIYFLSLTFCSMNKLKSHISFTCKSFMFWVLHRKNFFAKGNKGNGGGGGGAGGEVVLTPPLPLLSPFTALVVDIYIIKNVVMIVIMINVMLEIL